MIPLLQLLQQTFPDKTKEQLQAYIACRQVHIDGHTATSDKEMYSEHSSVSLHIPRYVSRGGVKLEYALGAFGVDVSDLVVLDAGCSTGGFTDCLLQHGSKMVHAVDVGYNVLDYKLRSDPRVQVHERTNIMNIGTLEPQCALAVADLSFRSITKAASHILSLTTKQILIALIKPQFEVPKQRTDFSGVIHDPWLLHDVLLNVYRQLKAEGVGVEHLVESPIRGRKGNREFLALLNKGEGLSEKEFVASFTVQESDLQPK